jgi:guanylate kinase
MENRKIIIIGRGGSGKDYLRKKLVEKGHTYGVSFTSRPPREGEINSVDYFFRTKEEIEELRDNGNFVELQEFNGWYYGITHTEFREKDVFILTPSGVRDLPKEYRDISFIIYLDPGKDVILKRLSERNDADDPRRRMLADTIDFLGFTDYDLIIRNEDF